MVLNAVVLVFHTRFTVITVKGKYNIHIICITQYWRICALIIQVQALYSGACIVLLRLCSKDSVVTCMVVNFHQTCVSYVEHLLTDP